MLQFFPTIYKLDEFRWILEVGGIKIQQGKYMIFILVLRSC